MTNEEKLEAIRVCISDLGSMLADVEASLDQFTSTLFQRLWSIRKIVLSEGWKAASNGAGRRHWFVMTSDGPKYHRDSKDKLIRYGSFEAAQAVADKLNKID